LGTAQVSLILGVLMLMLLALIVKTGIDDPIQQTNSTIRE